jgi:hypothetical protein
MVVPCFSCELHRVHRVAPPSASAACVRRPVRGGHLEMGPGFASTPLQAAVSSRSPSGAGLPSLPHRRSVHVVPPDFDGFTAHGPFVRRAPSGPYQVLGSLCLHRSPRFLAGLPLAVRVTEVTRIDAILLDLALQACCILQPILGFAVFRVRGSSSPLTRAAWCPPVILPHGARAPRSLHSIG